MACQPFTVLHSVLHSYAYLCNSGVSNSNIYEGHIWTIKGIAGHKKKTKQIQPNADDFYDSAGHIITSGGPHAARVNGNPCVPIVISYWSRSGGRFKKFVTTVIRT
jgi:hypothetical protein